MTQVAKPDLGLECRGDTVVPVVDPPVMVVVTAVDEVEVLDIPLTSVEWGGGAWLAYVDESFRVRDNLRSNDRVLTHSDANSLPDSETPEP